MARKSIFDMEWFAKKLASKEPIYLSRAEKEYILLVMSEVEDYERILDVMDQRPYRKLYLKEEREKRKGLLYPDADEIYRKYFEQREHIEFLQKKYFEKDAIICDLHKKIMKLTPET